MTPPLSSFAITSLLIHTQNTYDDRSNWWLSRSNASHSPLCMQKSAHRKFAVLCVSADYTQSLCPVVTLDFFFFVFPSCNLFLASLPPYPYANASSLDPYRGNLTLTQHLNLSIVPQIDYGWRNLKIKFHDGHIHNRKFCAISIRWKIPMNISSESEGCERDERDDVNRRGYFSFPLLNFHLRSVFKLNSNEFLFLLLGKILLKKV